MIKQNNKRKLDRIRNYSKANNFCLYSPLPEEFSKLIQGFLDTVEGASNIDAFKNVYAHNHDILKVFKNTKTGKTGAVALLPLTKSGHIALADGRLDTINPDLKHITKPTEKPDAVYIWGVGITPYVTAGLAKVMQFLDTEPFLGKNLYAKAANEKSHKLLLNLGFRYGANIHDNWLPDLFSYERETYDLKHNQDNQPLYDSYNSVGSKNNTIGITVVHNAEDLNKVFMIRGATYLGEQHIPWHEDVDGNDYCAAHLLGYIGTAPAGCLRLRFFANFAKLERLAVLTHFRKSHMAFKLVKAGVQYANAKGYKRLYGQAEDSVRPLWERFGFVTREGASLRYLTDKTYLEGDMVITPHPSPITPCTDPYVILRPEGQWHVEGQLEKKAHDTAKKYYYQS